MLRAPKKILFLHRQLLEGTLTARRHLDWLNAALTPTCTPPLRDPGSFEADSARAGSVGLLTKVFCRRNYIRLRDMALLCSSTHFSGDSPGGGLRCAELITHFPDSRSKCRAAHMRILWGWD